MGIHWSDWRSPLAGRGELAEDVVHDAFLRVSKSLPSITNPVAYLRKAVVNGGVTASATARSKPATPLAHPCRYPDLRSTRRGRRCRLCLSATGRHWCCAFMPTWRWRTWPNCSAVVTVRRSPSSIAACAN